MIAHALTRLGIGNRTARALTVALVVLLSGCAAVALSGSPYLGPATVFLATLAAIIDPNADHAAAANAG